MIWPKSTAGDDAWPECSSSLPPSWEGSGTGGDALKPRAALPSAGVLPAGTQPDLWPAAGPREPPLGSHAPCRLTPDPAAPAFSVKLNQKMKERATSALFSSLFSPA